MKPYHLHTIFYITFSVIFQFFESAATAEVPAAALALRWFQEDGGTLGRIIEILREFPRNDVIELLEDEAVHAGTITEWGHLNIGLRNVLAVCISLE
jgi:hypothetical protein